MHKLNRPNIVILLSDQERFPQYYPAGWAEKHLHTRKRLEQHGLRFDNAFNCTSMCSPSRTSLFTGLYPAQSLVTDTLTYNDAPPQPTYSYLETMISWYLPNMAKLLKLSGYSVVYKGKWHLTKPMNGCTWTQNDVAMVAEIGFSEWDYPDAGEDTDPAHFGGGTADNDGRYLNDAITYIQQLDVKQGPFALILSMVNPHDVLAYPQTWQGQYPPEMLLGDIQLPPTIVEDLSTKPRCQAQALQLMNVALGPLSSEQDQLNYINFYANLQKKVDHQMGQLLDVLEDRHLLRDTVVFRLADHGELGLSHNGFRQKAFVTYEEAIHIPLIISNPQMFPEPRVTQSLVTMVDLMPTLATLTGTRPPRDWSFDGVDLSPILEDANASVQDEILFTFDDQRAGFSGQISATQQPNHIRCIRTNDWKYAYYFDPKELSNPQHAQPREYEMYNLADNPEETKNLANPAVKGYDLPEIVRKREELAARLDHLVADKLTPRRQGVGA
jgi:choline-sulfatase